MSKTPAKKLVKKIAPDIAAYLKQGNLNPDFVENNLSYVGIDRIQDLQSILKIHFVLTKEVVEFIKALPERVRRIKTESKKEMIERRGEVRGSIDWKHTVPKRSIDNSIFVCRNPTRNYDVPENIVLKELLSVIYHVLEKDLKTPIEEGYTWLKKLEDEELINQLKNIFKKNVHVNRISRPEEYGATERDISVAENSRKELYKDSAHLLLKYRRMMELNLEDDEMKNLLDETLILPGEIHRLFEFYAVFSYLKKLNKKYEVKPIKAGADSIAEFFEDDLVVTVYHNSTGKLRFYGEIEELKNEVCNIDHLEQYRRSVVEHTEIIKKYLEEDKGGYKSGRPDMLIEYRRDGNLERLLVGEFKYSHRKQAFSQGLKELLEYLHFARENKKESYLIDKKNVDISGVFIIDKIPAKADADLVYDGEGYKVDIYDTEELMNLYAEN